MELPQLEDSALEVTERVAMLTFRRDDVRNALTGTALVDDIVRTVAWANDEDGVSVLIVTGAWFLQRLIGYQAAAELTLTGRILTAEEALKIGLFLEVVEPDELLPRVRAIAAELPAKPPQAVRLAKRLLKLAQRSELPDFLDLCASFQAMAHQTDDHGEAVSAFLDKRKGRYHGR
jgi:enoyl-CoA hydratase/carnithine racemase